MAETKGSGSETTRRGFMVACGLGAVAASLPAGAATAGDGAGPAAHLPALRDWYGRELEGFLRDVRPELVAGTMGRPTESPGEPWKAGYAPFHRLENAVRDRFGLHTTEGDDGVAGDAAGAYLVLAVAKTAEEMSDDWHHPAHFAAAVVTEDVLQAAEARGWIERDA